MNKPADRHQPAPAVAVLLCTYNGQRFLAEQLDSIAAQTHPNWFVWVSDDGSKDRTPAILEAYREKWGSDRLALGSGPGLGVAANFLSLACNDRIQAGYYAFSDQDDRWEPDKLARALRWLQTVESSTPALYCSRTRLMNEAGAMVGTSQLFNKPPGFANALVQTIGGGNTMVFNNAARELVRAAGPDVGVIIHDWWVYLVVAGCGGIVHYDPQPTVSYRQHGRNIFGSNLGWAAALPRAFKLLVGDFRDWNDANVLALERLRSRLTPENRRILDEFSRARNRSLLPRLIGIKRSGIYRQTGLGNLGLVAGAILKRL